MQERLELGCQDQVNQENGHGDGQQHAARRRVHLPVLAAQIDAEIIGHRQPGQPGLDAPPNAPQVDSRQIGRHERHALLIYAPDLAWPLVQVHLGHGIERHGAAFGAGLRRPAVRRLGFLPGRVPVRYVFRIRVTTTAGVDGQGLQLGDLLPILLPRADEDVDFPVSRGKPGGDASAYLVPDRVGRLADIHAQGRHAIAVEDDHDFRMPGLHQGSGIPKAFQAFEGVHDLAADGTKITQVVPPDFHLKRRLETEQGGADKLQPGLGDIRQAEPEPVHDVVASLTPHRLRLEHHGYPGDVFPLFLDERAARFHSAYHDVDLFDIRVFPDQVFYPGCGRVRGGQRRAGRQDEVDREFTLFQFRDQFGPQARDQHRRGRYDRRNEEHSDEPVFQRAG